MNEVTQPMSENKRLDKESMRGLIFKKQIISSIVVLIVFSAIIISSCLKLISADVTGTLLGAAIGYSLKSLKKKK